MDRETARQEIKRRRSCLEYLKKSKSGNYCCPFCGSGTGANGTGAVKFYKDSGRWYCHSCERGGDYIDLYQQAHGVDHNEALSLLAQEEGIEIEHYNPFYVSMPTQTTQEAAERPQDVSTAKGGIDVSTDTKKALEGTGEAVEGTADYTNYYLNCKMWLPQNPAAVAYLQGRGISLETAAAYWIGFDPEADPAAMPGKVEKNVSRPHPCPRIIIPTSKAHYVARSIDPATPKAFSKLNPSKTKGAGSPGIFNLRALYAQDAQEVFIVEGAFDALSIIEAGYPAIALNSAGNGKILIDQLERRRTEATLILCPDNDADPKTADKVRKYFQTLADGLQRLNISHITADICAGYKDANEALVKANGAFLEALEGAQRRTAARPDNTQYYIDTLMAGEIDRFKNEKVTGFPSLDKQAGGLYSGLYVLAAISSLGKTSFALQLADQLATDQINSRGEVVPGSDVIFFSLEQSRLELVSKSIARRTVRTDPATGGLQFDKAVTSLAIRKGYLPAQVREAAKEYKEAVADRISIVEGNFACNISFIGEYIRQYIRKTGNRPVVFIDYLQILQPAEDAKRQARQTTKEIVDTAVTELKRMSRELDLTVIVISSVNRANYLTPIDFESLKESGGIEFSCDVLWGLQLQCLNDSLFSGDGKVKEKREKVKQAKAANPRYIELSCLKNRYGIANYSCYFKYYPANDLFTECPPEELDFEFIVSTPKAGRKLK